MDTLADALLRWRTLGGTAVREMRRTTDPERRAAVRAVRAGLRLPELPRGRRRPGEVWAIALVRDEADVLPATLDHLERQGVDHVLVADNGSVDGTLALLEERSREGRLHLAHDTEPAYHQAVKMTALARAAWRAGADWVVPVDADELWFADSGRLADRLRGIADDVVTARLTNAFPTRSGGWAVDTVPHWHGKVAFRAHPLAALGQGNHQVDRPGPRSDPSTAPLRIAHLPWRSLDQLARKVRQGAAAYRGVAGGDHLGGHWRALAEHEDDVLGERWEALLDGRRVEGMHWSPSGRLVAGDPRTWTTWDPDGVAEPS